MKPFLLHYGSAIWVSIMVLLWSQLDGSNGLDASEYEVAERGPHYSRWVSQAQELDESGQPMTRTRSFIELSMGLNYWEPSVESWTNSVAQFETIGQGFLARRLQSKTLVASDLLDVNGTVDIEMRDGQRLRATPIALAYYSPLNGADTVLATTRSVAPQLVPPNGALFADCFDGVKADVLYLVMPNGVSQYVILREQPPTPETFGIDSEVARLEVLTEFLESPVPQKHVRLLASIEDPALREQVAEPDFVDTSLDFGALRMRAGHAFSLSAFDEAGQPVKPEDAVPVGKTWVEIEGRTILFESIDYWSILPELMELPIGQQASTEPGSGTSRVQVASVADTASGQRDPAQRLVAAARRLQTSNPADLLLTGGRAGTGIRSIPKRSQMSLSAVHRERTATGIVDETPGFILDFDLSGVQEDFVFRGDTTYYVTSGSFAVEDEAIIEGGCVIKFRPGKELAFFGTVDCQTSPYSPAIFTARDDDTVGETIDTSDGDPSGGYFAYYAISIGDYYTSPGRIELHDLRIGFADHGIYFNPYSGDGHVVRNIQLHHCDIGIKADLNSGDASVFNGLFNECDTAFDLTDSHFVGQNLTVHDANTLYASSGTSSLTLTNSLLVDITSAGNWTGNFNADLCGQSGSSVFASVGAGDHYLQLASVHRNAGSANIDPTLADQLKTLTTYAPLVIDATLTKDTTLAPRVRRDVDTPDLGYHYTPLDYVLDVRVQDATLTILPGTSIGSHNYRAIRIVQRQLLFPVTTIRFSGFSAFLSSRPPTAKRFMMGGLEKKNASW